MAVYDSFPHRLLSQSPLAMLAAMRSSSLATKLLLVLLALITNGCFTPLTMEQQSDWRWKQWNPDYRSPYPPDPGTGAR